MNIKGAYIVRLDLADSHLLGVARKIRAQNSALLTSVSEMDLYYIHNGDIVKNGTMLRHYGAGSLWRRITYYFMFYLFMGRQPLAVDFIYIRYQRSSPIFLYMLSRLKSRNPELVILIEIPSFPYHAENTFIRGWVLGLVDRLSRPFLRLYVDRIVTFSKETEIFGIPTIRTDNGVDVDRLKLSPTPLETETFRLLGVANLSFWHGYDRIIAGLAEYYAAGGKRKIHFNIIGSGHELERLQNDTREAELTDHVRFLGPRHGVQLDEAFSNCNLAIGVIGMHRRPIDTSDLKSREYCARGLPFVTAYEDRDFGKELPFIFHAPANEDPVDIAALLVFYDHLMTIQPGFNEAMRKYAEKHLTWEAKLKPVIVTVHELLVQKKKYSPA